jgi:spore coat protein CotH
MNINLRRNYSIILILIALVSILVFALGDARVIAYTTSPTATVTANVEGVDYANHVKLFDDTVVHSVQVIMDDDDYDEMLATYQQTQLKEYFKADVIIDGVRINDVGIRLKGNASLRTALGGGMGGDGGGNRPEGGNMPQDGERPAPLEGMPNFGNGAPPQRPEANSEDNAQSDESAQGGVDPQMPQRGVGMESESSEKKIPFMIKFDKYVEGQTYQGYTNLSIRNYGTSYNEAMLQEPLTNLVARLSGIPATETAYMGFKINDGEETLYVISELVNENYLEEHFENADGILYKAELGSTLSYEGEDPSSYANSFTQQTRVNDADLAPLIEFMRFLDEADDETFEKDLPNYLDVDSFATYLAVNAMVVNTDSILGMNNNYYLYYDDEAEKFTLLMWDANESFGKLGGSATYDLSLTNTQSGRGEGGMNRPAENNDTKAPENNNGGPGGGGMGRGGGGPGGGQNTLLTRFMASETFKALYEEKLQVVYEQAFTSGAVTETAERYSDLIHSVNEERGLVDLEAYDKAVENILNFIDQRTEYLKSTGMFE